MAWRLNTALTGFRDAVNAAYPNRDKASDGTIGDPAHAVRTSDHNPDEDGTVDAWDMDVDLRSGNDAAAIAELKRVFQAHPSSKYWIHNDQICFRNEGWRPRSYSYAGPSRNRHDKHVHWNTRESHEDSTAPWILEDDVTPQELLNTRVASPALGDRTVGDWLKGGEAARRAADAAAAKVDALLPVLEAIAAKVDIDPAELDAVKAAARAGAVEGATAAADSIAAAVVARLPQETGSLTLDAVRDAVAAELAERLAA